MMRIFNRKKDESPLERQKRIKINMLNAKRDFIVKELNNTNKSFEKRDFKKQLLEVDYQISILNASEGLYSTFPDYLYDGDPESLAEKNFIINGLLDKIVELEGYTDGIPSEDRKILLIHGLRSQFEVKMNPTKKLYINI